VERLQLDILFNHENRGFAAACNQGARLGTAPCLLFLNPDVRVELGSVAGAAQYIDDPAHFGVGVVGIKMIDPEGRVCRSCAHADRWRASVANLVPGSAVPDVGAAPFPDELGSWLHSTPSTSSWVRFS